MTENADVIPRPGLARDLARVYTPKDPWADIRGVGGNPYDPPMQSSIVHPYMLQADRYLSNVANSTMIPWHVISKGRVSRQPKEWDPYKWYIGETLPTDQFQPQKAENDPEYYWSNNSSNPNWSGPNPTNEWNVRNRQYLRCFSQSGGNYEACNKLYFGDRFPNSQMEWAEPTGVLWDGNRC